MAESNQFQPIITRNLTATITDNATESNIVNLSGTTLTALEISAEFDGAAIGLQASSTVDGDFVAVHEQGGAALAISAAASRLVTLEPAKFAGLQYIKLISDTAQSGATDITLLTRPV